MAVVVQCYHCSNILELDEGFRGGVCRCSQCGSLLQVPKSAGGETRKARPAAPGAVTGQRPASPGQDTGLSRGQFDPKNARTGPGSSKAGEAGIGSGAFARSPMRPGARGSAVAQREKGASVDVHAQAEKIKKSTPMIWVGIILAVLVGAAFIVAVIVLLVNFMREDKHASSGGPSGGPGNSVVVSHNGVVEHTGVPAMPAGAHFLTIKLTGKRIVFGLDAGSASTDSYSYMAEAVVKAVPTLEADQEFCVVLWREDGCERFPASGWAKKSGLSSVEEDIKRVGPNGVADALTAMKYCLAVGGDQTILATAKTGLAPDLATAVLAVRKPEQEIDTVGVGSDPDSPLKVIAEKASGTYLSVDMTRLKELLHPAAP